LCWSRAWPCTFNGAAPIAEHGLKVRYTTTANLVNELAEAANEKRLSKVLYRYARYDLLLLDEFGYLNLDRTGAKLLFQIFTEREERKAIAVASNAPFSEWDKTFADERLCLAITDPCVPRNSGGIENETGA
jgi:DNA replication protein DnaC